jgi:hypothetical protein
MRIQEDTMTEVRITNRNWHYGHKTVKRLGGRYNPDSRTWSLPDTDSVRDHLREPAIYSLEVVGAASNRRPAGCDCPSGALGHPCTCC